MLKHKTYNIKVFDVNNSKKYLGPRVLKYEVVSKFISDLVHFN